MYKIKSVKTLYTVQRDGFEFQGHTHYLTINLCTVQSRFRNLLKQTQHTFHKAAAARPFSHPRVFSGILRKSTDEMRKLLMRLGKRVE